MREPHKKRWIIQNLSQFAYFVKKKFFFFPLQILCIQMIWAYGPYLDMKSSIISFIEMRGYLSTIYYIFVLLLSFVNFVPCKWFPRNGKLHWPQWLWCRDVDSSRPHWQSQTTEKKKVYSFHHFKIYNSHGNRRPQTAKMFIRWKSRKKNFSFHWNGLHRIDMWSGRYLLLLSLPYIDTKANTLSVKSSEIVLCVHETKKLLFIKRWFNKLFNSSTIQISTWINL